MTPLDLALANLAAWSAQAAAVALAAALLARLAPIERPAARLAFGQALLALVVALPLLQPWRSPSGEVGWSLALVRLGDVVEPGSTAGTDTPQATRSWAVLVAGLLAAGLCAQALWLGVRLAGIRSLRRRARAWEPPPWLAALRDELAPRTRFVVSEEVGSPATCGLRRPIVLLPASFAAMDRLRQEAIATHELLHAQRGDWLAALVEELLKTLLFFHPAVHWLVGRIRLAREQTVDAAVVRRLGGREVYLESLVEAARAAVRARVIPAAPFMRESHLRERVELLLKEVAMSPVRTLVHLGATAVAIVLSVSWAVSAAPLQSAAGSAATAAKPQAAPAPSAQKGAGVDTADAVKGGAPKILRKANPSYPADAKAEGVEGWFEIDLTIGKDGAVRDPRVVASAPDAERLKQAIARKGSPEAMQGDARLAAAALDAVKSWVYEPVRKDGQPVEARATVSVNFRLH